VDQHRQPVGRRRLLDVANQRSRALADRLGFPDGRRDEVVYGLLAAEWLARRISRKGTGCR